MSRFETWAAVAIVSAAILFAGASNRYRPAGAATSGTVWVVDGLTGEARICLSGAPGALPWRCTAVTEE